MQEGTCSVEGCERPIRSKGYCNMHYQRVANTGAPGAAAPIPKYRLCTVEGCDRPHESHGLCGRHGYRLKHWGHVGPAGRIRSEKGDGWIQQGYRYLSVGNGRRIPEHRQIMERLLGRPLEVWENIHHINGMRHDNRPENLELWVKPQPVGQRPSDLAEWVVEHYPELVAAAQEDRSQLRLGL